MCRVSLDMKLLKAFLVLLFITQYFYVSFVDWSYSGQYGEYFIWKYPHNVKTRKPVDLWHSCSAQMKRLNESLNMAYFDANIFGHE